MDRETLQSFAGNLLLCRKMMVIDMFAISEEKETCEIENNSNDCVLGHLDERAVWVERTLAGLMLQ